MKVMVLGGSPKGNKSVTMQYIEYLQVRYPQHTFQVEYPAFYLKKFENKTVEFQALMEKIRKADLIIWAFPLYFCLVHSNYKRFIELLFERKAQSYFEGKYTASLSTSIHFFDHAAHNYIHSICDDLKMSYIGRHSPKMDDLTKKSGQQELCSFMELLDWTVKNQVKLPIEHKPIEHSKGSSLDLPKTEIKKIQTEKTVLILVDELKGNIKNMIESFNQFLEAPARVIELSTLKVNHCLGCLKCGDKNQCVYQDKDDYMSFFKSKVTKADIIVFAGTIRDRYLSSIWQRFFDRSFFNTHQPTLDRKQFAFLISGPISQLDNAKHILTSYTEWQGSQHNGFVSDESNDGDLIVQRMQSLAQRLVYNSDNNIELSKSFLRDGGLKIFRDDIFDHLKIIFRADHRFYKNHKLYDFPQDLWIKRLSMTLIYWITSIPFIKRKMYKTMTTFMLNPFKKTLSQAKKGELWNQK